MAYVVSQRGVRALSRLVRGSSSASTTTFSPATISPDDFAPPFTVQWAQSVDSSGAWIIWLPSASLVILDGTPLDITSALNAAGGDYPAGWYKLPSALLPDAGGTLYLLVTLPQGTTPASAAFSASAGSSGQWTIPICLAAKDVTTDARTVKQYVSSALVFGGAGGGGLSGAVEFVADADWYVNGSVHVLRKRLRILDLATGQVTDKPNTTYGNGWELLANTTPISNIINGGS